MPRSYLYKQGYKPQIGHLYRTGFKIELGDGSDSVSGGGAGPQGFQGAAGGGGGGGTGTINNFDDVTIINGQTGDFLVLGTGGIWENKTPCEAFQYEDVDNSIAICGTVTDVYGIAIGHDSLAGGNHAVALGVNADARGNNSVVLGPSGSDGDYNDCVNIGNGNENLSNNSVVIGTDARVYNQGISIGNLAGPRTAGPTTFSVAIGAHSLTNAVFGNNIVGIGQSAMSYGGTENIGIGANAGIGGEQTRGNIAIGAFTKVADGSGGTGVGNIAIGQTALAEAQFNSIALGFEASSLSDNAISIGANSSSTNDYSICLGASGTCDGSNAIYIGASGSCNYAESISIGHLTNVSSEEAIAIGHDSHAGASDLVIGRGAGQPDGGTGTYNIALGVNAMYEATGTPSHNVAIGQNACRNGGNYSVAIGHVAGETDSDNSVSIGALSDSSANDCVALGATALAQAANSIAIGSQSTASGTHSIAIGTNSYATQNSIMIGPTAGNVFGSSNVGIGLKALRFPNNASAIGNVAIGATALSGLTTGAYNTGVGCSAGDTITTGDNNTCLGYLADVQPGDDSSVAIGHAAGISGNSSVAIGHEAEANDDFAVAIGATAVAGHAGAIALGAGAISGAVNEFCVPSTIASVSSGTALILASDGQIGPTTSSKKFKNNIRNLEDDLDDRVFESLEARRFEWKDNGKTDIGFVAQEVLPLCPELVPLDQYGEPRSVNYERFSVLNFNRIKKLEKRIKYLEEALDRLLR